MDCPYDKKCWRLAYTKYVLDNPNTQQNEYPDRATLFFLGYADASIANMRKSKRTGKDYYPGMYAETMPIAGDPATHCPALSGNYEDCHEYKKEHDSWQKYEAKKKEREQRYPNKRKRQYIPVDIRRAISQRDKYNCVYCNRNSQILKLTGVKCQVDHFVPLAKGGDPVAPSNLVFSCQKCNRAKGEDIWERGCRIGFYDEIGEEAT